MLSDLPGIQNQSASEIGQVRHRGQQMIGSARECEGVPILGGFGEDDEFGFENGHALSFEE